MQARTSQTLHIDQAILWPAVAQSPLLWRITAYAMLLGLVVLVHTWSRVDARETSLALDRARVQAELFRSQNERLLLELATMNSLGSLNSRAATLALSHDVDLVEVY
jgi:hypothetical protein